MSPNREVLIHTALRLRPRDAEHFSDLAAVPVDEALSIMRAMRVDGLIVDDEGVTTYPSPAARVEQQVQERLRHHLERTRTVLEQAMRVSRQLPASIQVIRGDELTSDAHPIEVFSGGLDASFKALDRLAGDGGRSFGGHIVGLVPVLRAEVLKNTDFMARWREVSQHATSFKVVIPPIPEGVDVDVITQYDQPRIEMRTIPQPMSWMWVERLSGQLALPLAWGESNPSTVVVIRDHAAAGLAASLFDALWADSNPITPAEGTEAWESLLRCMRVGLSLEEAAAHLGIHPRTARRRLEAGMQHYGVETLFGLGTAWAADREGVQLPPVRGRARL